MSATIDSAAVWKCLLRFTAVVRAAFAGLLLAWAAAGTASARTLYLAPGAMPKAECRPQGFEELACGDYGTFFVGGEAKSEAVAGPGADCGLTAFSGDPGIYPETALASFPDLGADAWTPCFEGSCFTEEPSGPWVAVVDWDNLHGWSVAETIRQASGGAVETRLFPLAAPGLAALEASPAVGDLHVLVQLCRVAEAAASKPPVAVNMSFGRLAAAPCAPGAPSLACAVSGVLGQLRAAGIALFAAAGNDGRLLYPAADPEVLAIGSVDLRHLASTGEARPLPQTPADVRGLFPGNGIYLEEPDGDRFWAAPPGSSYASAFAAGWWAGFRGEAPKLARKVLGLCSGTLAPSTAGGAFHLACGSWTLPQSQASVPAGLLATALGQRPEVCGVGVPADALAIEIAGPAQPLAELTLAELQADSSRPTPDGRPCVPCHGGGGGGDSGSGGTSGGGGTTITDDPKAVSPDTKARGPLVIDLSRSYGIPEGLELLGLYLQVGDATYRFSDSENVTLLGEIALGRVAALIVSGTTTDVRRQPVALVYELRLRGDDGRVFRSSTPVLVHDH